MNVAPNHLFNKHTACSLLAINLHYFLFNASSVSVREKGPLSKNNYKEITKNVEITQVLLHSSPEYSKFYHGIEFFFFLYFFFIFLFFLWSEWFVLSDIICGVILQAAISESINCFTLGRNSMRRKCLLSVKENIINFTLYFARTQFTLVTCNLWAISFLRLPNIIETL